MSLYSFVVFVLTIAGVTSYNSKFAVAVYALSFWHYYIYWLAYLFRAVPLATFKRDAIVMKCVSITVLGWAFFSGTPDILSASVVLLGFSLNAYAAMILGSDRCYYGYEVAGIPYHRITLFPYSLTAHPMLIGNMVAFSGILINPDFRAHWWSLAVVHTALNFGLLIMEITISADSKFVRSVRMSSIAARYVIGFSVLPLGAAIGYAAAAPGDHSIGTLLGVITSAFVLTLFSLYSTDARDSTLHHTIADGNVT